MSITKVQNKIDTEVANSNETYKVLDTMIKTDEVSSQDHYILIIKLLKEKIDELVDEVNNLKSS
tara:strand:+ start:587 stop:778 length:192 start_codon:yes stop_codon:yes gene_type:complete